MNEEKLIRGIGRWDLTAIVINTVIGAGIFGLPSKAYALIGPYSLIAIVICAVIISLIVLCYAEVASRFRVTGGPYLYAHEAFGTGTAFGSRFSAMAKRLATDSGSAIVNDALQLFGGYGYLKDYPIERFWRDLRVHSILEGTNQVMRMIVGRDLLRQ